MCRNPRLPVEGTRVCEDRGSSKRSTSKRVIRDTEDGQSCIIQVILNFAPQLPNQLMAARGFVREM